MESSDRRVAVDQSRVSSRAKQLMREWAVRCNCGGPSYGTGHSPDCDVELMWSDAVEVARDEVNDIN